MVFLVKHYFQRILEHFHDFMLYVVKGDKCEVPSSVRTVASLASALTFCSEYEAETVRREVLFTAAGSQMAHLLPTPLKRSTTNVFHE